MSAREQAAVTWAQRNNWGLRRKKLRTRLARLHDYTCEPLEQLAPEQALRDLEPRLAQLHPTPPKYAATMATADGTI